MDSVYNPNDINSVEFCEERIKEIEKIIEKEGTVPINNDHEKLHRELELIRGNLYHTFTFLEHQIKNNVDDINEIVVEVNKKIITLLYLFEKTFDFDLIRNTFIEEYNDIHKEMNNLISHLSIYGNNCNERGSKEFEEWGSKYIELKKFILRNLDKLIKYNR